MSVYDPEAQQVQGPDTTYFAAPVAAADADDVVDSRRFAQAAVNAQSSATKLFTFPLNGKTDTHGYLFMKGPRVPQGFRDRVVNIVVGGLTYQSVVPGTCTILNCGTDPDAGNPSGVPFAAPLIMVADYAGSLPLVAFYDLHEMVIQQGNFLCAQIYDSTEAADQYSLVYRVFREPMSDPLI